jgi:hypothetical protein
MAATARSTAFVALRWTAAGAEVADVRERCGDGTLLDLLADPAHERVGVDVPFGWPRAFVRAVAAHAAAEPWPWRGEDSERVRREHLRFRRTDVVAAARLRRPPMTAAFDRLGAATARWAHLADELAARGVPVARDGGGRAAEVYPAGARAVWGLGRSLAEVRAVLPVAAAPGHEARLRDEHVFDAFVAALVARAVALGLAHPPAPEDADLAREEGWLWLPEPGSLVRLR